MFISVLMLYVYLNMIKILNIIQTLNLSMVGATSLIDNSLMLSKKGLKLIF